MSGSRIPVDLTPEQILAAARVLVRAVLAKMKPDPAVIEAVAHNVARVLPGYGSPPVHPAPISVPNPEAVPRVTDPRLPHWIVRNQTLRGPGEFKPRHFFMHPTQDLAEAEARRMAKRLPGNYFAVYASGAVFYEEVPPPPPVEETGA
jgi:hypothetical protein